MVGRIKRKEGIALAQGLALAPVVAGIRAPILMMEAFGDLSSPRPESTRAVTEKLSAIGEGMLAAQLAWFNAMALWPLHVTKRRSPVAPLAALAETMAMAALKPAGKKVRQNHRRLSRREVR